MVIGPKCGDTGGRAVLLSFVTIIQARAPSITFDHFYAQLHATIQYHGSIQKVTPAG